MINKFHSTIGGILLFRFIAVFLVCVPFAVRADYTAVVNPNSVLVTDFQGWGSSLCWWANVIGGYANRTNYVDMAFSQLKLNIVRYNIGGGENPTNNFLSYRATMQGFEPTNGVWNWNADLNQRWVLQAALARGANLVDAFANSPPWWMTVSGSVTGAVGGTNNLQVADETLFADYLATVVSNLTVLDGVHFNYVTPMNEPVGSKWDYGNSQEGCDMSASQQIPVINALRTALNTSLPSAGIDASEDVDPYQTVSSIDTYPSATLNNLALCTTHTYTETGNTSLASEANTIGKPLWVAEYGDSDGTGLTMARRIYEDITGMGVQAWVYWQVVDSASGWGFLLNPLVASTNSSYTTNYTINQKFYVMGQFSEFVRPGYEIISVNDTNTLAAYNPTNSTLVLVMVNNLASNYNVTYNLGDFSSLPWQIAVSQTSSGENIAALSAPIVANQQFTTAIRASSVTTFVLTTNVIAPSITNQFPATYGSEATVFAGETPAFSVLASGTVPLYYQWFSNSVAIAGCTNAVYTPTNLLLNGLSFDCVVSNIAGRATSSVWTVSVVPAPVAAYPRSVLSLHPIAFWRLNEAEQGGGDDGVVAVDYGGGNNGIYTNVLLGQQGYNTLTEPSQTSARFGFVQSKNSCACGIPSPDFSLPNGSNAEFTVEAWVNSTGANGLNTPTVAAKGYYYQEEFALDAGAPNSSLRFSVRNAAGTAYNASSTLSLTNSGKWQHLAGVCDEANGLVSLYTNGALAASVAIPTACGIYNSFLTPLTIGSRSSYPTNGFDQQFPGYISDVAIYNYVLNPTQIQTLYTAGISFPSVGLTMTNMGANSLQLNWNYGTLQYATNIAGPFQNMPNAVQPYTIPLTNSHQFYRIKEN